MCTRTQPGTSEPLGPLSSVLGSLDGVFRGAPGSVHPRLGAFQLIPLLSQPSLSPDSASGNPAPVLTSLVMPNPLAAPSCLASQRRSGGLEVKMGLGSLVSPDTFGAVLGFPKQESDGCVLEKKGGF